MKTIENVHGFLFGQPSICWGLQSSLWGRRRSEAVPIGSGSPRFGATHRSPPSSSFILYPLTGLSQVVRYVPLCGHMFLGCKWKPRQVARSSGPTVELDPQNSRQNENKWQFQAANSFSMFFPWLPCWFSGKLFPIPFLFPPSEMLRSLEVAEVREGAGGISATAAWFQERFWSVSVPRDIFMVFLGTLW